MVSQAAGASQESQAGGISIDGASGSENRFIIGGAVPHHDIVPHRSVEQPHVLRYITDVAPQVGWINLINIHPVYEDRTAVGLIQTHDEFRDGTLS